MARLNLVFDRSIAGMNLEAMHTLEFDKYAEVDPRTT